MCKAYYDSNKGQCCIDCPVYNIQCLWLKDIKEDAEPLVEAVEEWSAEHPVKTCQSVFLGYYPEANIGENGILHMCPAEISAYYRGKKGGCGDPDMPCATCRSKFWMQEVE